MKVKNWEKFQHYKKRKPPWIRFYRDLLDDDEFFELPGEVFKSLAMLWLIASEDPNMAGELPAIKKLAFRMRTTEAEVEAALSQLNHWVEMDASAGLSTRPQHALSETETETETEGETDAPAREQYEYEGDTDSDSKKIVELIMQSFPDWDQVAVEVAVMKMRGLAIGFDFGTWQDIIARSVAVTLPEHGPRDYQITISKKINGVKIRAEEAAKAQEQKTGRPQPKYKPSKPEPPETAEQKAIRLAAAAECTAKIKELVGSKTLPEGAEGEK